MKKNLLITLMLLLSTLAFGQERTVSEIRSLKPYTPQLLEYPDLHIAAGIVQSPQGYAVMTYDLIPAQSLMGLYGQSLQVSGVTKAVIQHQGEELVLDVEVWPVGWLKIEVMTFRLPPEVHGEVWVKTMGRFDVSNTVRFFVE
jgi:hypothetical protein